MPGPNAHARPRRSPATPPRRLTRTRALHQCKMEGTTAAGFDISGALMADGDFSKVNFKESQLSKVRPSAAPRPHSPAAQPHATAPRRGLGLCVCVCRVFGRQARRLSHHQPSRARRAPACPARLPQVWAPGAKFDGADFTNGVIDRAYFKGCSFRGAIFSNAVLSGSVFEESDMQDSDFTDAYLGDFDQRKLCKNPTLKGENPITGAPTRPSAGCPALKE